jgi:probable O-glycosylation ligase (exosortase A-associated)
MRDIALLLFFVFVIRYALRHTWIGALLWTWLSLFNPHKLTYGFANTAPFAMVTALVTLLSIFRDKKNLRVPRDATVFCLIVFLLWMCICTVNAIFPDLSYRDLDANLKIQLMTLVAISALRTRKQIEAFIWVVVVSVGFYGFKGGIFTIMTGGSGRVWGPTDTYLYGNNELGLALTMIIPLMNYLRMVSPHVWVRRGLILTMVLSAAAVLGSQSRGALLAIAAMTFVLWMRSQRKFLGGVALVLLSIGLVAFMPASWDNRMKSIGSYDQDDSANSRFNSWTTAVNIANDRITGGGFAIKHPAVFRQYSPRPEWVFTAHSIYFQAIGELGWIGLVLFMSIGATSFWKTFWMRSRGRQHDEARWLYDLGGMLQVSMIGYAVGGAFLSLAYLDLAYDVAVIIICSAAWLKEERWKTEPQGLFGSGIPIGRIKIPRRAFA